MINSNYQDFLKVLISIEKGIEDENILEELYDRFMDNDGVNLINDYFDDVMYDLEQENTVSEKIVVKEKVKESMKLDEIHEGKKSIIKVLKAYNKIDIKLDNKKVNQNEAVL